MNYPDSFQYTKDHEWTKKESETQFTVGVTDHAQEALGDIVFVELPKVGRTLKKGETFGVVESIKAVSDLYAPVSGKVIAINESLPQEPSLINQDPHSKAWMIKMEISNPAELKELMSSGDYTKFVQSLG